jgi:hypothetical protein
MPDQESLEYFRKREQAERDAAKNAASEEARRAHEDLAENYSERVRGNGTVDLA